MKKSILLVLVLTPVWLCAQQKVIQLVSTTGNAESYALSSISKHTFRDGKLVTSFNNGQADVETQLAELNKVLFSSEDLSQLVGQTADVDYTLYPMPVPDDLHLSFTSQVQGAATLEVLSLDGRVMLSSIQTVVNGSNTLHLAVGDLQRGVYICRLTYGSEHYIQQIIKK